MNKRYYTNGLAALRQESLRSPDGKVNLLLVVDSTLNRITKI